MKNTFLFNILPALFFICLGSILCMMYQFENAWDFTNYHFYNPFAFLNNRINYDIVPASINTFFNPLIDLPYYITIQHFNNYPFIVKGIQGIWFGLLLFVFFKFAGLFFDIRTLKGFFSTLLIIAIATTGQATWFQAGTSTNEIQIAFLEFTAVYFIFKMIKFPQTQKGYVYFICGLILGCALGLKPTCIYVCVGTGIALMCFYKYLKRPFLFVTLFAASGLTGYLIVNGWWMYKMWDLYGNPFFPFLNGIFQSPYFDNFNYTDRRFIPPLHIMPIYPFVWLQGKYRALETEFSDPRGIIFYTVALIFFVWMFIKPNRIIDFFKNHKLWAFYSVFTLLCYILWLNLFGIYRYLLLVEMLASIYFVKLIFYYQPKSNIKFIGYNSFIMLLCGMCIVNILLGTNLSANQQLSNKLVEIEDIRLPENTLIKLYNFPTAGVIPLLAKNNPPFRAVGYMQINMTKMEGSDFVERGKFREIRDEIEQAHTGPIIIIYYGGYRDATLLDDVDPAFIKYANEQWYDLRKAIKKEAQGKYCRPLKNTLTDGLNICVPIELKDKILTASEEDL